MVFKVCFLFDKNGIQGNKLLDVIFNVTKENVNFFKNRNEGEMKNQYIALSNELDTLHHSAKVVEQDDGFLLSLEIPNNSEKFNEISEDGRRLWLRQHIEDIFLKYFRNGLMFKQMEYVKEHLTDVPSSNEFRMLENALNKALDGANNKSTKMFWIVGE